MNKQQEEKRTVIGRVTRIGANEYDATGEHIISTRNLFTSDKTGKSGLDIELAELSTGKFWQLTVFGEVSLAEVDGFTLTVGEEGAMAWVQNFPTLEVGHIVAATGPYTLRPYTSKKTGKPGAKDSLRIYNFRQQVKIVSLPERPHAQKLQPPAPPKRRNRKAS
jgi:hypothetical protein